MSMETSGLPHNEQQETKKNPRVIEVGTKFKIKDEVFTFEGVVEEDGNKDNGKPVGKNGDLHRVFEPQDLDKGIFLYEGEELIKDINDTIPTLMKDYWGMMCTDNTENNPEKLPLPHK